MKKNENVRQQPEIRDLQQFIHFSMVEEPQYIQQGQRILAIPMKKTDKPPLLYLPLDSVKGLLDQPDRSTIHGKRDAVLLALLYDTGARVQEVVDLKVGDIALNDTVTILLTGKGGKSRIGPSMKSTGGLVRQYVTGAGLSAPVYTWNPLFTNRSNKPLTEAYDSHSTEELPTWKKDNDLLGWLKSL